MKRYLKVLLIVYIIEAAAMVVAGTVMWVISSRLGLYPPIGLFLLLVGLAQLSIGIWLYKRRGKGIWGSDNGGISNR